MNISEENLTSPIFDLNPNIMGDLFNKTMSCTTGFWIFTAVGYTIFLVGFPLNAWALWLMVKDKQRLVATDMFGINLAVMEVSYCLLSPIIWFNVHSPNKILSIAMPCVNGFIMAGQPLFQCCICVERYLAVVHPVTYLKYKPLMYRVTCSGAVWLLALGFSGFTVLHLPEFPVYLFTSLVVAVLAVSLFCSFSILRVLRQSGPGAGKKEAKNPQKQKAFTIVMIILLMMLVNNLPFPLIGIACKTGLILPDCSNLAYGITFSLFMVGAFVQPLMYLVKMGRLPCLQ